MTKNTNNPILHAIGFFATFFSFSLFSCSVPTTGSQAITSTSKYPRVIEKAKKDQRYFIMQSGINVYNVTSVDLDKAKKEMTVTLDKVDSSRLVAVKNIAVNNSGLPANDSAAIFIDLKDSTSYTFDEPHTIPLQQVKRVELFR